MGKMVLYATLGTLFCFFMTTLGSATVFLTKKNGSSRFTSLLVGASSGVMLAAVIWSLIIPSLTWNENKSVYGWMATTIGIILGAAFLALIDVFTPEVKENDVRKNKKRTKLLFLSVTIHNIPEGMAVGLSIALAVASHQSITLLGAFMLALGVGIQNFPEGSAISLPYYQDGNKKSKAFLYGMLSGIVEPLAGILVVFIAQPMVSLLPWILSFAAGTMLYVVVKELIPEAHENHHRLDLGTIGFIIGFLIMMSLDVLLG